MKKTSILILTILLLALGSISFGAGSGGTNDDPDDDNRGVMVTYQDDDCFGEPTTCYVY